MDIKTYQTIIEKTAVYPKDIGIMYCTLGLCGESGEVAEKVKKLYRDNLYVDIEFVESLKKEIGDVLWYVTALASEFGITLEEVMQTNYDKLINRLENNTIHGSGSER